MVATIGIPLGFAAGALAMDGWPARRFLLFYVAPFFLAFFPWLRLRMNEWPRTPAGAIWIDGAVVVLGAARFAGAPVPFSGHTLFFAYSALTTRSAAYAVAVAVLAAVTTWFKLALWNDFASWAAGTAVGVAFAAARILIHRPSRTCSAP